MGSTCEFCQHFRVGPMGGITVAVTSLPQYIAYAELAQLSGFRGAWGFTGKPPEGVSVRMMMVVFDASMFFFGSLKTSISS